MSYREILPPPTLAPFLDAVWTYTSPVQPEMTRILPDGFADLILSWPDTIAHPQAAHLCVSGMMTCFRDVALSSRQNFLGFRFQPGKMAGFARIPLHELKNESISASEFLSPKVLAALQAREGKDFPAALFQVLSTALQRSSPPDLQICAVAQYITRRAGQLRLRDTAQQFNLSPRQLERRFKARVGLTMKEFQQVSRLRNTLHELARAKEKNLLDIAFENGYYDQAHLSHTLKKMTGKTATDFR